MLLQTVIFALLACLAQSTFVEPPESNNGKDDFKRTYSVNDKIGIKFSSNGWDQYRSDLMDLWVVSWKSDSYSSRLQKKQNVTLSSSATIDWTVNIPADTIKSSDQFVFQFKKAVDNDKYDSKSLALSSAGFTVRSSSSSSSSTKSSSKSKKKGKKSKVKGGKLAGIVIGVLVGVALLLIIALVLLRKAKQKKENEVEYSAVADKSETGAATDNKAPAQVNESEQSRQNP